MDVLTLNYISKLLTPPKHKHNLKKKIIVKLITPSYFVNNLTILKFLNELIETT